MALQGTIDTFELTEVVRMLAAGGKTGRLRLEGSRGAGSVWVADGKVVATAVDHAPLATDAAEALYELLRFEDGAFTFAPGDEPAEATEPADVEEIITAAETTLAEWREIEKVVPTTRATVVLRPELSRADVVIDRPRWRMIAAVGSGATVATLGHALDLGELPVSRAVKDLVELGVVELTEERLEEPVEPVMEPAPEPALAVETFDAVEVLPPTDGTARAQLDEFAAGFGLSDSSAAEPEPMVDPTAPSADGLAGFGVDGAGGFDDLPPLPSVDVDSDPLGGDDGSFLAAGGDAAEVARQLSNLSPAAARAVAAAAKATTEEEREAALAAVSQDGEDPIDRELLLRFLASVKS